MSESQTGDPAAALPLGVRKATHLQNVGSQFKHHFTVNINKLLKGKKKIKVSLMFHLLRFEQLIN